MRTSPFNFCAWNLRAYLVLGLVLYSRALKFNTPTLSDGMLNVTWKKEDSDPASVHICLIGCISNDMRGPGAVLPSFQESWSGNFQQLALESTAIMASGCKIQADDMLDGEPPNSSPRVYDTSPEFDPGDETTTQDNGNATAVTKSQTSTGPTSIQSASPTTPPTSGSSAAVRNPLSGSSIISQTVNPAVNYTTLGRTMGSSTRGVPSTQTPMIPDIPATTQITSSNGTSNNSFIDNTHHSTPVGAIIGGVIGGLIFLIFLILLFIWHRRRSRRSKAPSYNNTTTFRPIHPNEEYETQLNSAMDQVQRQSEFPVDKKEEYEDADGSISLACSDGPDAKGDAVLQRKAEIMREIDLTLAARQGSDTSSWHTDKTVVD